MACEIKKVAPKERLLFSIILVDIFIFISKFCSNISYMTLSKYWKIQFLGSHEVQNTAVSAAF